MSCFLRVFVALAFALPIVISSETLVAQAPDPSPVVTPDGQSVSVGTGTSGNIAQFTVTNNRRPECNGPFGLCGDEDPIMEDTFTLTCAGRDEVIGCSSPTSVVVQRNGGTANVSVTHNAGSTHGGGTGRVVLTAADAAGTDSGYYSVTVTDPHKLPVLELDRHNGDNHVAGVCAADCFDVVLAFSNPAYYTMDTPRSVTLMYRSSTAAPRGFVTIDATDNSATAPTKMSLRLQRPDNSFVTFMNGSTEMFFTGASGRSRLSAQFDAATLTTGAYVYTAIVTSHWPSHQRQSSASVRVLIQNEIASPYGAGWTIAGLQRLYVQAGGATITDGDGSIRWYSAQACGQLSCAFAKPSGEYSTLTKYPRAGVPGDSIYIRRSPDGTESLFSRIGALERITDRFGNTTLVTTDANPSKVLNITDPRFKVTTFGYSDGTDGWKAGTLRWIQDGGGRWVGFGVDANNNMRHLLDIGPNLALDVSYDSLHRVIWYLDANSSRYDFAYDYAGKISQAIAPTVATNAGNVRPTHGLTAPERTLLIDPGTSLGSSSNPAPRVEGDSVWAVRTDAEGIKLRMRTDRWGQPVLIKDSLANVTVVAYAGPGLPSYIRTPTNSFDTYSYDPVSGVPTVITPYEKDPTYIRYGVNAQPDSVWGPNQAGVRSFLGASGQVDSVRIAGVIRQRYYYNQRGQVDSIRDFGDATEGPHVTRFRYHSTWGNLDSMSMHGGQYSAASFDSYGRLTTVRTLGAAPVRTEYDGLNRVTKQWSEGVTDAGASFRDTVRYFYNQLYVDSIRDGRNQVNRWDRNVLGWVTKEYDLDPTKGFLAFVYDRNGRVVSTTNRRSQTINFSYDVLGRVLSKWGTNATTDSFTYAPNGIWMVGWNSNARTEVYHRANGWTDSLVTVVAGQRFRSRYTPLSNGRLSSVLINNSTGSISFASRAYFYEGSTQLLSSVVIAGNNTITFGRNQEWLVDTVAYPGGVKRWRYYTTRHEPYRNGFTTPQLDGRLWRAYGYDSLGNIALQVHRAEPNFVTSTQIATAYKYSKAGFLLGDTSVVKNFTCPTGENNFGHRCPIEAAAEFTFDGAGNSYRMNGTEQYDLANRQTRVERPYSRNVTYDLDGNMASKSAGTSGGSAYAYTWSADNRLTSVTADNLVSQTTVAYGYDAFGRLSQRLTDNVVDRTYLWDVDGNLLAELNGAATARIAEYVHTGLDQPLAIVTGATSVQRVRFVEQDLLGNVVGVFSGGDSTWQLLRYDPWGTNGGTVLEGALGDTSRLRWKGLVWQGYPANLYYARNRWVDPEMGRFVSEDPIGVAGGINLYAFASNDPINGFDPFGLSECSEWDGYQDHYEPSDTTGPTTPRPISEGVRVTRGAFHDCSAAREAAELLRIMRDVALNSMSLSFLPTTAWSRSLQGPGNIIIVDYEEPYLRTCPTGPVSFSRMGVSQGQRNPKRWLYVQTVSVRATGPRVRDPSGVSVRPYQGSIFFVDFISADRYDITGTVTCSTGGYVFHTR